MEYEILGSGSKGNCVVIENVMVDCGIAFKKMKDVLYDVDYLLITHQHGDHLGKRAYHKIRNQFPNIITIANSAVAKQVDDDVDYIVEAGQELDLEEYTFHTFKCIHDVPTQGYYWTFEEETEDGTKKIDIIYATDTHDYRYAPPKKKFDYLFLESNHDENKLNAIQYTSKRKYGYDAYGNGIRHASTQVCKGYYYLHRKSEDSELIELHKSERFY